MVFVELEWRSGSVFVVHSARVGVIRCYQGSTWVMVVIHITVSCLFILERIHWVR